MHPGLTMRNEMMKWVLLGACLGCTISTPAQTNVLPQPFVNSLGMTFLAVPQTKTLMCLWETRVRDYEAFVKNAGLTWPQPEFAQGPDHPAVKVSWNDAVAFCQWLTERERKAGKLTDSQSYRLPTDVEWSLAVGLKDKPGATPQEKDRKIPGVYPWGPQWPPPKGAGNFAASLGVDSFEKTAPVGSFKPNPHGFYDLSGNVWEWCDDLYDGQSGQRVLRGGSWSIEGSDYLLSSRRFFYDPGQGNAYFGFRVVLAE
jgi:formylglycine-generating enzyme required for sulfatase activity